MGESCHPGHGGRFLCRKQVITGSQLDEFILEGRLWCVALDIIIIAVAHVAIVCCCLLLFAIVRCCLQCHCSLNEW